MDALGLGFRVRVKIKVRVREALVILDETLYCGPVLPTSEDSAVFLRTRLQIWFVVRVIKVWVRVSVSFSVRVSISNSVL